MFQNKITFIWRSGLSKKGKLWETSNQLNSYAFYIILDDDLSTPFCSSALPWTKGKTAVGGAPVGQWINSTGRPWGAVCACFFFANKLNIRKFGRSQQSLSRLTRQIYTNSHLIRFFNRFARGDVEIALDHRRAGRGATSPAAAKPMEAATWFPKP